MKYEEAVAQVIKEGAIRLYRLSGVWSIAYRIKKGAVQRRDIQRKNENDWALMVESVGSSVHPEKSGWYSADEIHPQAKLIEMEAAAKNPGYYEGFTRECQTCKLDKTIFDFERDMQAEQGFRTWECNDCADQRVSDSKSNVKQASRRVGDYLTRKTHLSKPPVESEI